MQYGINYCEIDKLKKVFDFLYACHAYTHVDTFGIWL